MWLLKVKEYFPISQKTIIRWLDEVIAYFDNRLYINFILH